MEVVIITGLSGSGKSKAADWFEDKGYYCIDNMPPALIKNFIDLATGEKQIEKVAFVVDARNPDISDDITIDEIGDDLDDLDDLDDQEPNDDDLITEEEVEIKVSDFDNIDSTPYQSDDIVKMYLHEIGQVDLLTITQELELARQVQDGLMSKEKMEQYEKSGKKLSSEDIKELEE